jgi:hypothetical protein
VFSPDGRHLATAVEYRLVVRDAETLQVGPDTTCLPCHTVGCRLNKERRQFKVPCCSPSYNRAPWIYRYEGSEYGV